MARLKDILQQQRKKNFVGRQKELAFFQNLLKEPEPPVHLVYIYGPGGQGKTTLLKQYADCCKESSIPFIQVDCRYIEPHPDSFQQLFQSASPFAEPGDISSAIDNHQGNVVLLIDTYEKLKPLDDWLRMEFLPELPGNVITVISGRSQLSTNWKTDPGWQSILKTFALQELSNEESTQLLSRRNIPEEQIQRIVSYTHGNPLALSIVADMFDQRKGSHFDPLDSPDIMKTLLEQFVQEVPSPAHKAALELCSLVYVTTEKLIEEVLGPQMAHELFNWLTTLTFIEKGPTGIYPHDIARDAIAAELHWRNPDWYRHLHIRTQQFFISRLLKQTGEKQREILFGLIFLHRLNPAVKPFFEFQETGSSWQDKMKENDRDHLKAIVKKYEGDTAVEYFSRWLDHEAAEVWVFRDAEKTPAGFVLKINMEKITGKTNDRVIDALLPYKKEWKIGEGEMMTVFRTWMSRDHYQNVSGVQSAVFLGIVQWYFTPGLAVSMLRCVNPEFWQQILNYADLHHIPGLDHELNDQSYGWYMHDWRQRPPLAWLELMGKREINEEETSGVKIWPVEQELTEQDFTDAVYEALKQVNNPKKIIGNILLRSQLVQKANSEEPTELNLALTLADKLIKTVASLENSPKEEALHRVLYRTFINPVGSQEQTADFLYMSFSTYRRQVKKGVERVADILWLEEKRIV
ncbi:MAG: ATP-binding protein [Bacteroidota bacterium]|nr:ATP-binding protein [Bacteroidota bacterium]